MRRCDVCEEPITRNDEIAQYSGFTTHIDCAEIDLPDDTGEPCSQCWLVHAGECF